MLLYLIIWFAATIPVGILVGRWLSRARVVRVEPQPIPERSGRTPDGPGTPAAETPAPSTPTAA